jgi:hypothetical protein
MDVEPSSDRRASTPVQEDDRPELLGEAGASPPLWGISFSGAGMGQGCPVTPDSGKKPAHGRDARAPN